MNSTSRPGFDHFAGDLVSQHQAFGRGGAASNHVLVAAADVGGNDLEKDAVFAFAIPERQLRKVDAVNLNDSGTHINHSAIACHDLQISSEEFPRRLLCHARIYPRFPCLANFFLPANSFRPAISFPVPRSLLSCSIHQRGYLPMTAIDADVATLFLEFSRQKLLDQYWPRLRKCVEPLTDEQVWWRPNDSSNSIGNLILHLNGNVHQWLVASFNRLEDNRDRPAEFNQRESISASALLERLGETMRQASEVLAQAHRQPNWSLPTKFRAITSPASMPFTRSWSTSDCTMGRLSTLPRLKAARDLGFYTRAEQDRPGFLKVGPVIDDRGRFLGLVAGLSRGGGGAGGRRFAAARPPARIAPRANYRLALDGGAGRGRGGLRRVDMAEAGPPAGARVRGRLRHRDFAQRRQSLHLPGPLSGISDRHQAAARCAPVGRGRRGRASRASSSSPGVTLLAALRMGHVDLRPAAAVRRVAPGARRVGRRPPSRSGFAACSRPRARCCR